MLIQKKTFTLPHLFGALLVCCTILAGTSQWGLLGAAITTMIGGVGIGCVGALQRGPSRIGLARLCIIAVLYSVVNFASVVAAARGLFRASGALTVPVAFGTVAPLGVCILAFLAIKELRDAVFVNLATGGFIMYVIGLALLNWFIFFFASGAV